MIGKSFGKNSGELAKIVIDILMPYKKLVHSITSDNGTEFAEHKKMSKKLLTEFFFAHLYSSWERGLSEYINKLVRQYIPKKSIFDIYSEQEIKDIQHKINRRPRKNLNYDNPKNLFDKFVNKKVAFASCNLPPPIISCLTNHKNSDLSMSIIMAIYTTSTKKIDIPFFLNTTYNKEYSLIN